MQDQPLSAIPLEIKHFCIVSSKRIIAHSSHILVYKIGMPKKAYVFLCTLKLENIETQNIYGF